MAKEIRSTTFTCVLNNVNELFDTNSTYFDNSNFKDTTRKKVKNFRKKLSGKQYTPEEIVDKLMQLWIGNKSDIRACAVNYEIGTNGIHHCHMLLESKNQVRASTIKNLYPTIHIEETKGTKQQVTEYMNKVGKHSNKNKQVVIGMKVIGEITANQEAIGQQGKRSDLEIIQLLLEEGLTPEQIMIQNLSYRRFSKMIKEHYYQLKVQKAPTVKNMEVFWHIGETGSGKSFQQVHLKENLGASNIYVLTDYENGGLDNYAAESILFMDEFKGDINYQTFLKILDVYPNQVHARYTNVYALWDTVHISSIFSPKEIYDRLVPVDKRINDPIQQLYRRIHFIIYHFKIDDTFKSITLSMSDYLQLVEPKVELKNIAKDFHLKDNQETNYTYQSNSPQKAAANNSTYQSEKDSDS